MTSLETEVARRRTFAIISHPDAGKTTLTEKLLLYGGAIHLAGAVKAKANQRHTTSDWMEIERQRGISVTTSVLQFDYQGAHINLLDTPGHKDFSEDTYRTLSAVDAAVMLIDAAKGVEPQTRKLFEVCRMRGIPIFTFFNKLDRPSRSPLDLLDELEKILGIRACPMSWPLGNGPDFKGVYDRRKKAVLVFDRSEEANAKNKITSREVYDVSEYQSELDLLEIAGDPFDHERVLKGELSPAFFGSAMNNFGVEHFLQNFIELAPPPGSRKTTSGAEVKSTDEKFSGFIFKIQANMDPSHRDRVAFFRICSGKFTRGMDVKHARLGKNVRISRSLNFLAQERVTVEDAWPGDIVGILDTSGDLRIGDALCTGTPVEFEGIPRFSPEQFATARVLDLMKRKQFTKGIEQLSEEGVVQVYRQPNMGDRDPVLGAVGALQLEVLKFRLQSEYGVSVAIDRLPYTHARWVVVEDGATLKREDLDRFEGNRSLEDRDGNPVVLFKSDWDLRWAEENYKHLKFLNTAPPRRVKV